MNKFLHILGQGLTVILFIPFVLSFVNFVRLGYTPQALDDFLFVGAFALSAVSLLEMKQLKRRAHTPLLIVSLVTSLLVLGVAALLCYAALRSGKWEALNLIYSMTAVGLSLLGWVRSLLDPV